MKRNLSQEYGMSKFYSDRFGFLHACKKDGKVWFNLTDICHILNLKLSEAERWLKNDKCEIREYNVRRSKVTTCNRYVDNDGLSSILILCCRGIANDYRRWIDYTIMFSFENPDKTRAIPELDERTRSQLTSPQIIDHYKAMASKNKRKSLVQQSVAVQEPVKAPRRADEPFVPKDGHLSIEDWFRHEFPVMEFVGIIDGLVSDAKKAIHSLPKKDQWPAQHRVNVISVFRDMLHANEENVAYSPTM